MDTVIGIDLGTSTTEAAVLRDGKPVMVINFDGKVTTPSVVGMDDTGNMVVGEKAEGQLLLAPDRTVKEAKRLMGTDRKLPMGTRQYSPVEISSMILTYVRNYAGKFLGEDVDRAVISVPAYFDEIQRQATVEAGKKAGFTVERILNEPTAAALSYGISHMEEESNILVYDLGGGTFDVTLLEMFGGVLEVRASSGDNRLGGKDFDEKLTEYLAGRFKEKHGISLEGDIYAMARLHQAAVECKKMLSTQEEYRVLLPVIAEKEGVPVELDETVTRECFEGLIEELIERTHEPIDVVLEDSNMAAEELDMVLLVGGSTRIPFVQRDIADYLGKEPSFAVDPDYAVAQGAAIQAGIINGMIDSEEGIMMTDVNPYTLGIRTLNGYTADYMSVIIPRNVTIPVTKKQTYYTSWDGQTAADIEVYQGESRSVENNHRIGMFNISGIPSGPAGKEQLEVAFSYNQNGMLNVTATILSTKEEASIAIDMMQTGMEERVDVSGWKEAGLAEDYRTVIRRAEKWLKKHEGEEEAEEDYRELEELVYQLKRAIIDGDDLEAEELEEDIRSMI